MTESSSTLRRRLRCGSGSRRTPARNSTGCARLGPLAPKPFDSCAAPGFLKPLLEEPCFGRLERLLVHGRDAHRQEFDQESSARQCYGTHYCAHGRFLESMPERRLQAIAAGSAKASMLALPTTVEERPFGDLVKIRASAAYCVG